MDFPSNTGTSEDDLPDFQQLRAMNVLVQCPKKSAHVDHSTFGYLSPCTAQSKADFQDALHHTADILSSSLHAYDLLFCQSPVDASPLMKTPSSIRFSKRHPVQPHCPRQANQEMIRAGLVPPPPYCSCSLPPPPPAPAYSILSISLMTWMIETYLLCL